MTFYFSKFLGLIRAVFPRWSFFDRVAHSYELQFKVPNAGNWQTVTFSENRPALGLFVNPQVNLAMANANLLEHFVTDVGDLQDDKGMIDSLVVSKLSSFRILCSLLEIQISQFNVSKKSLQFKIAAVTEDNRTDLFISDWLDLGAP